MSYPRAVTTIKQLEPTSLCNLKCVYCPYPTMPRAKIHMERGVFGRTLEWVRHFVQQGTQGELSLTGIGESLLHPEIIEMFARAREAIGPDRTLVLSTNGILLDDAMAQALGRSNVMVYVSNHRPEVAGRAVEVARLAGIFAGLNTAAATSSLDWAGQVDWPVSAPRRVCAFLQNGWGVVLSDGRITTCCMDADGSGVVGTVDDEPGSLGMKPYRLCPDCQDDPPADEAVPGMPKPERLVFL